MPEALWALLTLAAPRAEKSGHKMRRHGVLLRDAYAWLRQRDDGKVLDYLRAENAYTEAVMKPTEPLQKNIYKEFLSRIKETDMSVPARKDGYEYYSRTEEGKQYAIYCRRLLKSGSPEEILIDTNALAAGFDYFSLGDYAVSPDHRYLAYAVDVTGNEEYTLTIKDLQTGKLLKDEIPRTAAGMAWADDNETLFYNVLDDSKRPYKLMRHRRGTKASSDKEIYHEKDERFFLDITRTMDGRFLLLELSSKASSEVHFLSTAEPHGKFRRIAARRKDVEYAVESHGGRFFILTNDGAKNFKIMQAPAGQCGRKYWKTLISHRRHVLLDDLEVFEGHLVIYGRERGMTQVEVMDLANGEIHRIEFDEAVYTVDAGANYEFHSDKVRLNYTSLITPSTVLDYDLKRRTREIKKQQEVLGDYDPELYVSERIFARSRDGTGVPISIVHRRNLARDGQNPFFLYGYGSYGICIDPGFSSMRLSLLDRGFIFGIAHVRGGGEMGRSWYDDGKLKKKKHTFEDFIACAEYLVREKLTSPEKLVIGGGSAGGLLMGAVVNARPDLFRGVIMHVPFVDVVNTMLDRSLPLTVTEYDEWGNPQKKDFFKSIHAYSPYDHIEAKDYPAMFVTGGINDPRVQYWEPAKWVAKLRGLKTDVNPLLLKINMDAGHGGASGRYDYLKELALDYAFVLSILKLDGKKLMS
ncbi:MAG: oligopeptidase B [Omnitrophica bacterium GWA2_52_8]|nr:MAG: oligopeptidase B [Omnitrophica bacterium GWA2_52_8]